MLKELTLKLAEVKSLSDAEISVAVKELTDETASTESKAAFLTALACRGETPLEVAAFAKALREMAVPVPLDVKTRNSEILDVVGTGGDRLSTFNISTTVALVAASAGIFVAKHGNRAVTSLTGSADVIESLGIRLDLTPKEAADSLKEHHFAFFFAPRYHPAFKNIVGARKLCAERGQRTIFNILGPLLNPVRPTAHLIGVPTPAMCEPFASVLQSLGARRAMVVAGAAKKEDGKDVYLDELSTLGENYIAEFYRENALATCTLDPKRFAIQTACLADLRGGDRVVNANIIRQIIEGKDKGPKRDIVLLNAAAALMVGGKCKTLSDGWKMAVELLSSGAVVDKLKELAKN